MAKPNYQFDKRQRELAKQKKQNEKLAKKQARQSEGAAEDGTAADKAPAEG